MEALSPATKAALRPIAEVPPPKGAAAPVPGEQGDALVRGGAVLSGKGVVVPPRPKAIPPLLQKW
eukprot:4383825-Alexandrium_andersonii.AAC.1